MTRLVLLVAVVAFTAGNAAAQEARSVVQGVNHSANMLIAYLPAEKILVNADLYSPPAAGQAPAAPPAGMTSLRQNIQRLRLEVLQHAPIHGRVGTHEEFLRLVEPAGRTN